MEFATTEKKTAGTLAKFAALVNTANEAANLANHKASITNLLENF